MERGSFWYGVGEGAFCLGWSLVSRGMSASICGGGVANVGGVRVNGIGLRLVGWERGDEGGGDACAGEVMSDGSEVVDLIKVLLGRSEGFARSLLFCAWHDAATRVSLLLL